MLNFIADNTYRPFLAYSDKLERFTYLLLFLFPVAGMTVRHWISNFFILLIITGLFSLHRQREPLLKEEKIFLWICTAYVASFFVSSLVNGWGPPQTRYLGTEMRFLAVIPVYLLVRNYNDCTGWLLRGAIVGGFVLLGQALYDIIVLNLPTAWGIYSKNIIGPLSVITAFWGLYYFWVNSAKIGLPRQWILFSSVVGALIAAGLSGSRGSFVGFIITGLFCILFFTRPRWMVMVLVSVLSVAVLLYNNIDNVRNGVDRAYVSVVNYYEAENHAVDKSSTTSSGVRLEMWRAAILIFKDNVLFGVGAENYQASTIKYIDRKLVHPAVKEFDTPHNAYLEALMVKGIIGLILLLLLLYYPAFIYIRNYKIYKQTAVIGLIHIILISSFSLTDHSVIVKNNYVSILLLGMAVFLSAHFQVIRNSGQLNG